MVNDLGEKVNSLDKKIPAIAGSRITLSNNEIIIVKIIRSLENRGVLLKGTIRKITSQDGEFLSFLRPLMTAGLPLM